MAHRTEWTVKGCIVDVFADIAGPELAAINDEMAGSPRFDEIEYFVRDLTAVREQRLGYDDLSTAAFVNAAASCYKKRLKGAFIVSDPETQKRVVHYLHESRNAGCPWEQRLFFDRGSALRWVEGGARPT